MKQIWKQNETLNKWEKYFLSYLKYAQLRVELNENQGEDYPNRYWVIDPTATWEAEPCESAADIFEDHPLIIEELLDSLFEEAQDYILPEKLGDKVQYYPYQVEYWALLLEEAQNLGLEQFAQDYEWGLMVCQLIAFHTDEVDLEKIV